MTAIPYEQFCNNPSTAFDFFDQGRTFTVSRNGRLYKIAARIQPHTQEAEDDFAVSPEIQKEYEESLKERKEGKAVIFKSREEMDKYFGAV